MTRLDDLKRQLTALDALIADGVLKGDAARLARDRLEAQMLATVLQTAGGAADGGAEGGVKPAAAATELATPSAAARPSGRLLIGLALFALVFATAGYAWLGNPGAITVAPGMASAAAGEAAAQAAGRAQFEAMAERLAERLKTQPDDAEGWSMLARSYNLLERYPEALVAYQRVIALRPKAAQGYADYADVLGMSQGRKLAGEPEKWITQALQLDPDNAKALSLAGTVAFDKDDFARAAQRWQRALGQVEPGSEMAKRLRGGVDEARQRAGLPALPPEAAVASGATAAPATAEPDGPGNRAVGSSAVPGAPAASASVQVRIALAPALAAKAAPDDTVFIFARALQGAKAPLAIQRRQVKDLPLDLTLDDSMAMSPALRLSSVSQVVIGARISKSGHAMPQPGDLQGLSPAVAVGTRGLQLQIGEVLP